MALLRRLVLVTAALPLSVFALSLVVPTADACHDIAHGCAATCKTKVSAPLLCHDSSTLSFEKEGVVATATMQFSSYVSAGILVEAGVEATIMVTFSRSGQTSNTTVDLTTAFNATAAVAWDTPTTKADTLAAGQPTLTQLFHFHVPADAVEGVKVLEFAVLAKKANVGDTKWGLLAFETTAKKTGPFGLPVPWPGFAGGAVAILAGALLFASLRRTPPEGAKACPALATWLPLGRPAVERVYSHP
ncbi:MAG: hypothetical protein LC623_09560 [Halobacteriales archaeon]|nr:hypothetical protein [Halobacteriales archaeon]